MARKTGFLMHELYLWHEPGSAALFFPAGLKVQPGQHAENAETKRRFRNLMEVSGLLDQVTVVKPRYASEDEILRVHTRDYLEEIKAMSADRGGDAGEATTFGHGSYEIEPTRKYHRAVRLPEGDLAKARGDGTSKSAVSRRFVALSRKKMKAWLASDLSELDLLVIQIDGLHVGDHVLMAAIGVDGNGDKHVLAVVEGATENTVVVQALIDNLLARGLDPTLPRLFIVDGAKALSKAIRNTFGVAAAIQRCQVHKGRNIIERLPQHLHASVKKALRQAWDQDDANKAERLLRNLVRRLEHEEPGVSGSILEGLEEILTVIRLGLPHELRRSLACTNIVENALGTVRQVTRNGGDTPRWRSDGPPPACWRPRKPSVASRPIASCEMLSRNT